MQAMHNVGALMDKTTWDTISNSGVTAPIGWNQKRQLLLFLLFQRWLTVLQRASNALVSKDFLLCLFGTTERRLLSGQLQQALNATRDRSTSPSLEGVRAYAASSDASGPMTASITHHRKHLIKTTAIYCRDLWRLIIGELWPKAMASHRESGDEACKRDDDNGLVECSSPTGSGEWRKRDPGHRLQPFAADMDHERRFETCEIVLLRIVAIVLWVSSTCPSSIQYLCM